MTVLDVMIAVGGLTDFADGNAASITRTSEGDKRYSVRLKDLEARGHFGRYRNETRRYSDHPPRLVLK